MKELFFLFPLKNFSQIISWNRIQKKKFNKKFIKFRQIDVNIGEFRQIDVNILANAIFQWQRKIRSHHARFPVYLVDQN